jgi:hypothetical protein
MVLKLLQVEAFLAEVKWRGMRTPMLEICHKYGCCLDEVFHHGRERHVRLARAEVWHWMLVEMRWSPEMVGRLFKRNRSTVEGVVQHWQGVGKLR